MRVVVRVALSAESGIFKFDWTAGRPISTLASHPWESVMGAGGVFTPFSLSSPNRYPIQKPYLVSSHSPQPNV